jgi:chitin biosynthesis protein CHS5
MVPISSYYLGATPAAPMNAPPFTRPQSMSQVSLASPTRTNTTGSPGVPKGAGNRASMPPMARNGSTAGPMSPTSAETQARSLEVQKEESEDDAAPPPRKESLPLGPPEEEEDDLTARPRKGTMNKEFRFPPSKSSTPVPPLPGLAAVGSTERAEAEDTSKPRVIAPSSIEVPPPPPIEKERSSAASEEDDVDVGATEEIPL